MSGRAVSPSQAQLTWPASTDDSYNVDVDGRPWPHPLPGDIQTMHVLNPRDGTAYTFTVRAYDTSGNFSDPAHVTLQTPEKDDTTPPPAPPNLTATRPTPHTVNLRPASRTRSRLRSTWTASS